MKIKRKAKLEINIFLRMSLTLVKCKHCLVAHFSKRNSLTGLPSALWDIIYCYLTINHLSLHCSRTVEKIVLQCFPHFQFHSQFSLVQQLSHVLIFLTPWPGFPVHHHYPKLAQTHVHRVGYAIKPSHPLSSPPPPTFSLSQHQGFSNKSAFHIRWPKYWSFSFSISPSKEYSGLISFRMDWLDFLAVEGILKSLLQQHSSKASVLQSSAFFIANSHILSQLLENHSFDQMDLCRQSNIPTF